MKILITGSNGQLGSDLVKYLNNLNINNIGIDIEDLDLTNKDKVLEFFIKNKDITHIIHCAAYTSVDNAEDNIDLAYDINYESTKLLCEISKKNNITFMYISTDYVYPGEGQHPYKETDKTNPINVYGKSKLKGEEAVLQLLEEFFIIRISWVFGTNGNNFIYTMLKLSEDNKEINVIGDQYGSPTYTYDLCPLLLDILKSDKYGIYNASNDGYCSWYEFAKTIFEYSNKEIKVNSIDTKQYITKASRPKNSRMSKKKLIENGFYIPRYWKEALKHFINEIKIKIERN